MLQAIRDKTTGIIAWLIIGGLILVFSLWGIESYLQNDADIYVAKVNDVEITPQDFRFSMQQQINRLRVMYGSQFDRGIVNTPEFKEGVLNNLVEQEVLLQAAENAGMAISDALLAARIQGMSEFQEDGEFSNEKYQRLLRAQGMTAAQFEAQLRRSLLISQYVSGISGTAIVTDPTIEQALRLQGQTRDVSYVILPVAPRVASVKVSDEEVRSYYDEHKSRFTEPEQVKIAYLDLDLDELAKQIHVTDEEIRARYEEEKESLKSNEQRRARHILIKLDKNADDAAQLEAESKAKALIAKLNDGADFAELAKSESDDPGSAAQGGDLGFFGHGVMDPEFEKAVFAMKKGEISEVPVRTPFGLHIIQVTDIKAGKIPALAEVKDTLRDKIAKELAEEKFYELSDELGTYSFESPDNLDVAAEKTGLKIKTSGWFSRQGGAGIAAYSRVVEAAFSEDVLDAGNNSQVLELSPTRAVVFRVIEHKDQQPIPFETVKEMVRASLQRDKAAELVKAEGEQLLDTVRSGASLDELADKQNLEVKTVSAVTRGDARLDRQIVTHIFRTPRRSDDRPSVTGFTLQNGSYVVLEVTAIADAKVSNISAADKAAFRRNMTQLLGNEEMQFLLSDLKAKADIQLNLEAVR